MTFRQKIDAPASNSAESVSPLDQPIRTVLVTNDDGVSSPFFHSVIRALRASGRFEKIVFVAPAEEQSWIGSAVTRFRPLFAEPMLIDQCNGFVVSGTPSDCVYLGVENLFDFRPDLVVSGINIGTNTGRAFSVSSGTVSGAAAGFFIGCRSVAFSCRVPAEVFQHWGRHDLKALESFSEAWDRLGPVAVATLLKLIQANAWKIADVPSIDLPWNATIKAPARITNTASTYYRGIFEKIGENRFRHSFQGLHFGDPLGRVNTDQSPSDVETVGRGEISINLMSYAYAVPESQKRAADFEGVKALMEKPVGDPNPT